MSILIINNEYKERKFECILKQILKTLSLFIVSLVLLSLNNLVYSKEEDISNEKNIYLTFDDGPGGKVTEKVLDILKDEEVPASFFLIGEEINNQSALVKRIYDEGHSIGLHSMTHNQKKLYSSDEFFLKEMKETQEVINEVTGYSPYILRFPFGCNNTCYKLKESLVNSLHDNNYKIYDWNVDSSDGANPNASPSAIYKNSISDKSNITLLMHCSNLHKNTAKALPQIIKYYKEKGYVFKKIDETTPEVYHYITK